MIITKPELINSLQHEIDVLLHLATKVDRTKLDYRPTAKQRSTFEWFRYLSVMGPRLIEDTKAGAFNPPAWTKADEAASKRGFDETIAALRANRDLYASLLAGWSDADFRKDIEMFGNKTTTGAFLVNTVLCGHAAYRTQIFCYLKSCGREELSTKNLWAGMDPVPA